VEEHPKYQQLQTQCREREAECERLSAYSLDLEGRLQKLLGDFQLFRTKAHQMLAAKDDELDKAKGRGSPQKPPAFQNVPLGPEVPPQGKQLNLDYIKNVFIKYLEYQASANEKEALTLEKVLFTALQAADKDVELIEKARQKNQASFWSYFTQGSQLPSLVPRPLQLRGKQASDEFTFNINN